MELGELKVAMILIWYCENEAHSTFLPCNSFIPLCNSYQLYSYIKRVHSLSSLFELCALEKFLKVRKCFFINAAAIV